jgi:hypothetical protein
MHVNRSCRGVFQAVVCIVLSHHWTDYQSQQLSLSELRLRFEISIRAERSQTLPSTVKIFDGVACSKVI